MKIAASELLGQSGLFQHGVGQMSRQDRVVDHEAGSSDRAFPDFVIALTLADQTTIGGARYFLQLRREALDATARSRTFAMISMGGMASHSSDLTLTIVSVIPGPAQQEPGILSPSPLDSGFAPIGAPRNDEGTKCQKHDTRRSWIIPGSLASSASSVAAPVANANPLGRSAPSATQTPASPSHVARTMMVFKADSPLQPLAAKNAEKSRTEAAPGLSVQTCRGRWVVPRIQHRRARFLILADI
jgi:hypothetical protein